MENLEALNWKVLENIRIPMEFQWKILENLEASDWKILKIPMENCWKMATTYWKIIGILMEFQWKMLMISGIFDWKVLEFQWNPLENLRKIDTTYWKIIGKYWNSNGIPLELDKAKIKGNSNKLEFQTG